MSPSAIARAPSSGALAPRLVGEVFAHARHHCLSGGAEPGVTPWLGIGLCGRQLSAGLPVDVLTLLLALDATREALGADDAVVVIADSNARAAGFAEADVERRAAATERRLAEVAAQLGIEMSFVRGSDVAGWSDAARVSRRHPDAGPYAAHQLAQMIAMAQRGATVKVGWRAPGMLGDESHFDRLYDRFADRAPPLAFVYALAGRGLHPSRPRACPYVATDREERILLEPSEHIDAKLAAARDDAPREVQGYLRLLRKLGRALARRQGDRIAGPHEARVQALLDRLSPDPPT